MECGVHGCVLPVKTQGLAGLAQLARMFTSKIELSPTATSYFGARFRHDIGRALCSGSRRESTLTGGIDNRKGNSEAAFNHPRQAAR